MYTTKSTKLVANRFSRESEEFRMKKSILIAILTIIFIILAVLPLGLFVFGLKTFFNTVEKVAPPNTIEQQEEEQYEDSICECR